MKKTNEEIIKELDEEFEKAEDKEKYLLNLIEEAYGDRGENLNV